jgi:hypothetical protein
MEHKKNIRPRWGEWRVVSQVFAGKAWTSCPLSKAAQFHQTRVDIEST